ncbi:hypothetical protein L484_024168 [Morus notabilis]|uniref:Uncharacterized protein n=1 Tax=Morus notabilis TaxID=981085 RepID=W9RMB2_9ROSA|nr:hypothetical protein L484_024168 [Morus notabilis]
MEINIWSTHVDLLHHGHNQIGHVAAPQTDSGNRVWGCVFAMGSSTSYALWLIIQKSIEIVVSTTPIADNNKTCIISDNNNNNNSNNGSITIVNNE